MTLRSMRPASLPQEADDSNPMQMGAIPAKSQGMDFAGTPQEWMRGLGNAFRGMAEENSKLRAEFQSMRTSCEQEGSFGRPINGIPFAPTSTIEAAMLGRSRYFGQAPGRAQGGSGPDWIRDLSKTFFSGGRSWSQEMAGQVTGQALYGRPPALYDQLGLGSGVLCRHPSELPGSGICHSFGVPRNTTEYGGSAVRGRRGKPQPDPVGEPHRKSESMFDVERIQARQRERRGEPVEVDQGGPPGTGGSFDTFHRLYEVFGGAGPEARQQPSLQSASFSHGGNGDIFEGGARGIQQPPSGCGFDVVEGGARGIQQPSSGSFLSGLGGGSHGGNLPSSGLGGTGGGAGGNQQPSSGNGFGGFGHGGN